jgi:UDP-glucuronate decarboxylase
MKSADRQSIGTVASKRVLVTGGAGFLGSHLVDRLLNRGDHVIVLDSMLTGSAENLKHRNNDPNLNILVTDVINPIDLAVDQIFNLACPASPPLYQTDPVHTLKTSVLGALNVLECARRCGARVLQASTSEVYGDPYVHPQPESYWGNVNPIGIRSCYDEGKRTAETLFFDFHRLHGVEIKVARIFNTYGPRMNPDDGRVVSNFIVQALRGDAITIYGEGQQTRSFCYVDDLVSGLLSLMDCDAVVTGPINLGNPAEFTVLELAEKVLHMTQSRSSLEFCPLPQDDPKQRRPDITQAEQKLGWTPAIPLHDGLTRTIEYFRSVLVHNRTYVGGSSRGEL